MAEQAIEFQEKASQLAKIFETRQQASENKLKEKIAILEEENKALRAERDKNVLALDTSGEES